MYATYSAIRNLHLNFFYVFCAKFTLMTCIIEKE